MPNTIIPVDLGKAPEEQALRPHNRWHPSIPGVARVTPGEVFRIECSDLTGGQVLNSDSADDIRDLDLTQLHYLSGPVEVEGAHAGDVLVVDVLDVGTLPNAEWGFTAILQAGSGTGLLSKEYPDARKAIWDINGIYATSRHIRGVRFAGTPHPGIIGCAPSLEMVAEWNRREARILEKHGSRFTSEVALPRTRGALLGNLPEGRIEEIAAVAPRTWPARENGGNMDVKELGRGSRIYLPVHVDGALLSVGDLHFSQGDGKITGLGGVKIAGWIDLHLELIPDGIARLQIDNPVFEPNPLERGYHDYLTFQGISIDADDSQHYLDVLVAYRHACLNAIRYLEGYGYTGEQAYMLLAAAPVQGRLSCLLEHPNVCTTLALPKAIFDFPIEPNLGFMGGDHRGRAAD
ncbi:MAG: formamidase [Gemmatimonadota bacterium]